jgi:pSer/pThr/pTyr-binding forkhead associated (FHA) protein
MPLPPAILVVFAIQRGADGMDARLKIIGGSASGQMIPVSKGKLIIGRERDCDLQTRSGFVSRHHCVLLLDEFSLRIRDLGSQNGTFVNSRRIGKGEIILLHGDTIAVADLVLQVELVPARADVPPAADKGLPSAASVAMQGTGSFDGDTVQEDMPVVPPPANSPPAISPVETPGPSEPPVDKTI